MDDVLPLRSGDTGDAVRDLQQRLTAAGARHVGRAPGAYGPATEAGGAAPSRQQRGLPASGVCDAPTWTALVEAGYRLGDRLLYLQSPMQRGDDVAELQRALGTLGFDAGRVDGIFGPQTERALRDFQRNAGLTTDGVCGPRRPRPASSTSADRPDARPTSPASASARPSAPSPPCSSGRRIVVGEAGGLDVAGHRHRPAPAGRRRRRRRAPPPPPVGAGGRGQRLRRRPLRRAGPHRRRRREAAYYCTAGFESAGGRQLATLVVDELGDHARAADRRRRPAAGCPILRETRMPAVVCQLGPPTIDRRADRRAGHGAAPGPRGLGRPTRSSPSV